MIVRFFRYGTKVFQLPRLLAMLEDRRIQPEIPGQTIWLSTFLLFLLRLGSLNALEEMLKDTNRRSKWRRILGNRPPSADTIGYFADRVGCDSLRQILQAIYARLQRNHYLKQLRIGGWVLLAVDGHELFASYSRHCDECCQRTVHTAQGDRTQYYHRIVAAQLVGGTIPIFLDIEPQRPGENEIAAALRLIERIQDRYPKAYDVVTGDALYADPKIVSWVRNHHKHLVAVLKANHPDLLTDVRGLCKEITPTQKTVGNVHYLRWDIASLSSWTTLHEEVRVVRSQETKSRQGQPITSDWYWVTTLSVSEASTETLCRMGHVRWEIEEAFNVLNTYYDFDHAFRHHPNAILFFGLTACIVYVLVSAFYALNLKPSARNAYSLITLTRKFWLTLDRFLANPKGFTPIRGPT